MRLKYSDIVSVHRGQNSGKLLAINHMCLNDNNIFSSFSLSYFKILINETTLVPELTNRRCATVPPGYYF